MNTEDELNVLKEKALKYNPDIIIIGYVLNDYKNIDKNINTENKIITLPFFGFWLKNASYLYYFLETKLNKIMNKLKKEDNYEKIISEVYKSNENRNHNQKTFNEISKISSENDIPVILVIFPMISNLKDYKFNGEHEIIKELGEKNGFYTLDLLDAYKQYEESQLVVNQYDAHPNELAHNITAKEILKLLKERII
jgi:hypothetical protein